MRPDFLFPVIFIQHILDALAKITSNGAGMLLLAVITVFVTSVAAKRNHLTKQRVWSNILQLFLLWLGWALLSFQYGGNVVMADENAVFVFVFTSLLFICTILGIIIAALVRYYAPSPFPMLRAQIAVKLHNLAGQISDVEFDREQQKRAEQISKGVTTITQALEKRKATNV